MLYQAFVAPEGEGSTKFSLKWHNLIQRQLGLKINSSAVCFEYLLEASSSATLATLAATYMTHPNQLIYCPFVGISPEES